MRLSRYFTTSFLVLAATPILFPLSAHASRATLLVCNRGDTDVHVAVMHQEYDGYWYSRGWHHIRASPYSLRPCVAVSRNWSRNPTYYISVTMETDDGRVGYAPLVPSVIERQRNTQTYEMRDGRIAARHRVDLALSNFDPTNHIFCTYDSWNQKAAKLNDFKICNKDGDPGLFSVIVKLPLGNDYFMNEEFALDLYPNRNKPVFTYEEVNAKYGSRKPGSQSAQQTGTAGPPVAEALKPFGAAPATSLLEVAAKASAIYLTQVVPRIAKLNNVSMDESAKEAIVLDIIDFEQIPVTKTESENAYKRLLADHDEAMSAIIKAMTQNKTDQMTLGAIVSRTEKFAQKHQRLPWFAYAQAPFVPMPYRKHIEDHKSAIGDNLFYWAEVYSKNRADILKAADPAFPPGMMGE